MQLSVSEVDDFNLLSHWLAENDLAEREIDDVQLIILAGNAILPEIEGAMALSCQRGIPLLLSGGEGHSTEVLRAALAADRCYQQFATLPGGEGDLLQAMAIQAFDLPPEQVLNENRSRNCGENALFSLNFLQKAGKVPAKYLLVQDPLMQRRTKATYLHQWHQQGVQSECLSWPVFTPVLTRVDAQLTITGAPGSGGIWSLERYLSMILGEMVRLKDDVHGYGPNGKGFIGAVEMPGAVESAWRRLSENPRLAELSR